MYLNSSKKYTANNLMLNLNTFKSSTKLTILPTLCDTGKLECEVSKNRCDWHILAGNNPDWHIVSRNDERIPSHNLNSQ